MISKEQYIEGVRTGDQLVLKRIYQDNLPYFITWVKQNSGTEDDAYDVFQDGMEAVMHLTFKEDFELKVSMNALISRICKNKWLDILRKRATEDKVRNVLASRHTENAVLIDTVEQSISQQQIQQMLNESFMNISSLCQKVLSMLTEGHKPSEVAKELGMSNANTVYKRKFSCMEAWRKHIEDHAYYPKWKNSKNEY